MVVTVPEVRVTPDLKLATIFLMPLGGKGADTVVATFERHRKFLRGEVAHRINLRYAPELRFQLDTSFEEGDRSTRSSASPRSSATSAKADMTNRKRKGRDVSGWLCLDKRVGQTSTAAVGGGETPVRRAEGRPRRDPRPARLGRPADRARRGHEDRSLRPGRAQDLSLHRPLGRRDRQRRRRRQGGRDRPKRGRSRRRSWRSCPISPATSCSARRSSRR